MDKKQARMIVESLPSLYPMMRDVEEEAIWEILAEDINVPANEDCISRKAAIDALDGHFAIVGRNSAERFKMYIEAVINDIRKLPPAQPKELDTLIKALEAEHKKLREMQSATDKNVGTTDARQNFMDIVYSELESDSDNSRANRIIEAADEYAERRVDDALQVIEESQSAQLGTNLAEVGTDCISRQAAIDALRTCYDTETVTMDNGDEYINYGDAVGEIEQLPPIQSKLLQPWEVLVAQAVLPQPEPCEDAVSREEVLNCLEWQYPDKTPRTKIMELSPVTPKQPEQRKEILYRHYKGGTYELVCNNVTHTETEESLVIYRDCRGQLWARPESMFYGLVKVGDDLVPRFVLCRSEGDAE